MKSKIWTAVVSVILAGGLTMGLLWVLLNVSWIQKHFETTIEVNNQTLIDQLVNQSDTCNQSLAMYKQACQIVDNLIWMICQELVDRYG
jgi:hypothetical protein